MSIKFNVLNRLTGAVQFTAEIECGENEVPGVKLGLAVKWAIKARADLAGANLAGANLAEAYLARANLARAYLADANLARAYLARANLARAYLARANLADANLAGANLADANLARAYLADANLADANLAGANLADAYLARAYLADANLDPLTAARTSIVPSDGPYIGWKKCSDGVIVKLLIPAKAKRSNATGRKCRAEYADVLEVIGSAVGVSRHDGRTQYRVGQRVSCDAWDDNRWVECSGGIHHYITRVEAENH